MRTTLHPAPSKLCGGSVVDSYVSRIAKSPRSVLANFYSVVHNNDGLFSTIKTPKTKVHNTCSSHTDNIIMAHPLYTYNPPPQEQVSFGGLFSICISVKTFVDNNTLNIFCFFQNRHLSGLLRCPLRRRR